MKLRVSAAFGILISALLSAQQSMAGDMYLLVFYGAAPVSGVDVILDGEVAGTTNEQGGFDIFVDDGDHQIVLGAADQQIANFTFSLADGENIDIKVDAGGTGEPVVELDSYASGDTTGPTGLVSGAVVNKAGASVADATVSIIGMGIQTQTDTDGRFEINVPRGAHFIDASHPSEGDASDVEIRVVALILVLSCS